MSGRVTPTRAQAVEVQPLSSSRIQRAEGSILGPQAATSPPVRTLVPSAPGSVVPSVAQPRSAASLQPRVVPREQALVSLADAQTLPTFGPSAVHKEAKLLPTETMETSVARLLDTRPPLHQPGLVSTQSASLELREQNEAERNVFIRSMQETHTLQIRMLEELIEQKVAKVLDALAMVSSQSEERFAHTEAHRLDMRGDVDALRAHVMKVSDAQGGPERRDTRGDMLDAMANLQSDFEAIQHQHHGALSAIQAQSEEHRHLHSLHDDVRQKLDSVLQVHDQRQGELKMQLHSELSDIRHEINLMASQQRHHGAQLQELSDLHRELNLQGSQQRQQGAQLQELEAQVVQHLQGLKEEQQNEAQLLRQDLEATLAANSHGQGMMELQRKYEDVSRAVEVALRELPTERQAAPSLDRLESLEAERQERAREISGLLESLEAERQERIGEMSNLASFLQQEKEERIQIDEELDARQQQASQETYQAINQAFDEFRAEMRALADQMIRQVPDNAEIENMVAKAVRPERDARLEFTRCLEAERGTRVQDVENEREARASEITDLRAAIQQVCDKLEAPNEAAVSSKRIEIAEVEPALHHRIKVLSESHSNTQSELVELRAQVHTMERGHAEYVSSMRQETGELHDSSIEKASTLRVNRPELDPSSDIATLRGDMVAMRARVDALSARELPSERRPEHKRDHAVHPEIDAVSTALEEETAKRCEASAELHARITREAAEVSSRMELLWQELQEAISAESEERRTDIDAIRRISSEALDPHAIQSASSTATRVADRALELAQSLQEEIRAVLEREHAELEMRLSAEQAARLREISTCRTQLSQAVEEERLGRAAQNDEVRLDLLKAIAVERDERIAENSDRRGEIFKIVQEWHQVPQRNTEAVQEEVQKAANTEEAEESSGFITRFFRKSRAVATE
mmetsp:Transcript_19932/g.56152  ORF Transcript_19932/g.56152 Transcript_19932/m.56152 type:complete len:929 (-) Transcript_19932:184-2970(-)